MGFSFWTFFHSKVLHSTIHENRYFSRFLCTFRNYSKTMLTICSPILSFRYGCNSEIEFFLFMKVLIQNSNTVEFVKLLKKNQRLHIEVGGISLKMKSCGTMSKKNKKKTKKKMKIQDSMDKTNFFGTLPF
jgi:hypothetical protein